VAGGTSVGLAGTNFVAGTKVLFDGLPAVVSGFSGTAISTTTPAHPAPGFVDVTVVNPDGQVATLPGGFLYQGTGPVINTVALPACPMAGGTTVLIAGLNILPGATVTFGGVPGIAPSWDPLNKVLSVITPPGPTPGVPGSEAFVNVVVVNPDGQASPAFPRFRYGPPPVVAAFNPTAIIGGKVQCQTMTITGTDFSVPSTGIGRSVQVRVGPSIGAFPDALGNPPAAFGCRNVTPLPQPTPTALSIFLDAITPGSYRIIVTNFDGQFTAAPGIFFIPGP
jgi:hypothetical protein